MVVVDLQGRLVRTLGLPAGGCLRSAVFAGQTSCGLTQCSAASQLVYDHRWAQCSVDRHEGGLQVPRYLLINGTEPRWRLHDTVDSADLEQSLARVMENGVVLYTLASRNEGELFQSLTINGKHLVTYVIFEEADPDPAKTRSRYEAAGF